MAPESRHDQDGTSEGPVRDAAGRWLPGRTGNAGGRPKVVGEVRELCRRHTRTAVARLLRIIRYGRDEPARAAAEVLLAYGHGRPPQAIVAAVAEVQIDQEGLRAELLAKLTALAAAADVEAVALPAAGGSPENGDPLALQQAAEEMPSRGGTCERAVRGAVHSEAEDGAPEAPGEAGRAAP